MIYWISTGLVCLLLLASSASYVFHQGTIEGVRALGFPDHFRVQLAVLKLIAVPVLLLPFVPVQFKEWAYAGTALFLITALVAHTAHRDPVSFTLLNLIFLAILATSNLTMHRALGA